MLPARAEILALIERFRAAYERKDLTAVMVLLGGPLLMATVRRHAQAHLAARVAEPERRVAAQPDPARAGQGLRLLPVEAANGFFAGCGNAR